MAAEAVDGVVSDVTPTRILGGKFTVTSSFPRRSSRRRQTDGEDIPLPLLFDQIDEVSEFLDPVFINTMGSTAQWGPTERSWRCRSTLAS